MGKGKQFSTEEKSKIMCWGEIGIKSKRNRSKAGPQRESGPDPSQCAREAAVECLAAAAKGQIWTSQQDIQDPGPEAKGLC